MRMRALGALVVFAELFGAFASVFTSWHSYVRAPSSRVVYPKSVFNITGDVSNSEVLLRNDGVAILKRTRTPDAIPSLVLDFGQNIVGYPALDFAGASDNKPGIRLTFSETTEYLTNISDFTRSDNGDAITPGTDQFAVPASPYNWTDTDGCLYNGTQVCADGLHGFRYLRIALDALPEDAPYASPNGTVKIKSVSLQFTAFLGTPDTFSGYFECSDERLTQYWYDGSYTNEMSTDHFRASDVDPRNSSTPTLEGKMVLFDGAKRDRDPYVGDIAVSGRTAYLTHNVGEAARNVLADLADHQRSDGWIPPASINNYTLPLFDYPLWWAVTSWEYILYNGDMEYARAYFSNLVSVLDSWYVSVTNENGLLSKGLQNTSSYGDYAFLPRYGEVSYYSTLYVLALTNAASWASSLNDTTSSSRWSSRAAFVSSAINARLWDSTAGAYLDSTNTTNGILHPQDGNSLAILSGLASRSRALSSLNYLSTHNARFYGNAFYDGPLPGVDNTTDRVYAFISHFELQARFLTNQPDSALEQIDRMYGWMGSQDPGITIWEGIGPNGTKYEGAYTSASHGWSTGIVSLLTEYVLGVQPIGLGYKEWKAKPYVPTRLKWARGRVQTAFGGLEVEWRKVGEGGFEMKINAPEGTVGSVNVPNAKGRIVMLDGKEVGGEADDDGFVQIEKVQAGEHTISAQ